MIRKLTKKIKNTTVTIRVVETGETRSYDYSDLSGATQKSLGVLGLAYMLTDAAAGKSSDDILESIEKTWKRLLPSRWITEA